MNACLGLDTSNYTTSAALYDMETGGMRQEKAPLPVEPGKLGLRQSDAVFLHVRGLAPLLERLLAGASALSAVGASLSPRDEAGSYMPCFLPGETTARAVAAALGVPFYGFSHQAGHLAAALYATGNLRWMEEPFLAFHLSGGTTQCLLARPDEERILSISTLAETLDLNAGQLVDRVGGLLGLSFPAGEALEKLAEGSARNFSIRPAIKGGDCCLSGVENQCAAMARQGEPPEDVAQFCLQSLGAALLEMTCRAKEEYPHLPLAYAGGVMANKQIRAMVLERYGDAVFAPPAFSADNAAGIAVLASLRRRKGR